MKPIMITLLYLTFGGDIKMDTFEIQENCSGWFHQNVKVVENKKKTLFNARYLMSETFTLAPELQADTICNPSKSFAIICGKYLSIN